MKVRALWLRHAGNWHFSPETASHMTPGDHYIEVPDEMWDRFDKAQREFLAAGHELARLIPKDERYATIRAKTCTPDP